MPKRLKRIHEFRDPLHGFIRLDRQERLLVDSLPFQRLRDIHQLALTYLVYPGACHNRFEHSLGVLHLAGKVFDVVTDDSNIHPDIEHIIPDRKNLPYWRTVLCLAALCHDLGHLPFSHAAEKQLLEFGKDHESLTLTMIDSDYLKPVWKTGFRVNIDDVRKLAVGKKKLRGSRVVFDDWEAILSEIIVGDAFGVDRIDYLLRDSYHLGVSYGRFGYNKLIDSLRILPKSLQPEESTEPLLGVEEGGVHSAEALLLARFFMYEQVYFHNVRRIYDRHLIEFMTEYYKSIGGYKPVADFHLAQTDNEILVAIRSAASRRESVGHEAARAIATRGHFRRVYSRNPSDETVLKTSFEKGLIIPELDKPLSPGHYIWRELKKIFPVEKLKSDAVIPSSTNLNLFPVLMDDGRIEDSTTVSSVIANIPANVVDYIFADPAIAEEVRSWVGTHRQAILQGGQVG